MFILLVLVLLAGLPVAVWLELRNLTEQALLRQASDLNSVITSMRGYYANNVVSRVLASPGSTQVVHNYETISGAIPIPATLSLELGRTISEQQQNIAYRFVSDFPFKNRAPHALDDFETTSLAALRDRSDQKLTNVSWSILSDRVRLIAPVLMGAACVACHNSHAESPKRDWKIGDVRGIQEITISQSVCDQYLLIQISAGLFRLHGRDRLHLHNRTATPSGDDSQHQWRTRDRE
jgi:adenylate cyclase